jgi:hypothetical protein
MCTETEVTFTCGPPDAPHKEMKPTYCSAGVEAARWHNPQECSYFERSEPELGVRQGKCKKCRDEGARSNGTDGEGNSYVNGDGADK